MTDPIKLNIMTVKEIYKVLQEVASVHVEDNRQFGKTGVDAQLTQQDWTDYQLAPLSSLDPLQPKFRGNAVFGFGYATVKAIYAKAIQLDKDDGSFDGYVNVNPGDAEKEIIITANDEWNPIIEPYLGSIFPIVVETTDDQHQGTAWIIDREKLPGDGYRYWVITNAHVADREIGEERGHTIEVRKGDSTSEIELTLKGVDHMYDVAVLYFDSPDEFAVIPTDRVTEVKEGEEINIVGNQDAGGISHNVGTINSVIQYSDYTRTIQDTTQTYKGNSGSPVFNKGGKVIAICARGVPGKNINIPVSYVLNSYEQIRKTGRAVHGTLRIDTEHWGSNQLRTILKTTKETKKYTYALFISNVERGSSAEKVGLRHGDLILEYDGRPIYNEKEVGKFSDYIAQKKFGDRITLITYGGGKINILKAGVEEESYSIFPTVKIPNDILIQEIPESRKSRMGFKGVPGNMLFFESSGRGDEVSYRLRGILFQVNDKAIDSIGALRKYMGTNPKYLNLMYRTPPFIFGRPSVHTVMKRNPFYVNEPK